MRAKLRSKGDRYRPVVEVQKERKGVPTKVFFNGNEYALVHPNYINGNKNKAGKRRRK